MSGFGQLFEERFWIMSEGRKLLSDWPIGAEEALRLLAYSPEDLDPEDALFRSEVSRIVDELPHHTRTIARLIGVEDQRQVDVAELLRVDQSTVSRRWKRALELVERGLAK
jgi:DNA-directed RNA polymerase specialized sigma24 family protein